MMQLREWLFGPRRATIAQRNAELERRKQEELRKTREAVRRNKQAAIDLERTLECALRKNGKEPER
jgi:hypothetical protein